MNWSMMATVIVVVALLLGLGGGWGIAKKWGKPAQGGQSNAETKRPRLNLSIFVLFAFLLVVGAGGLIGYLEPKGNPPNPEIEMGLMIVTAIAALMTLLFVVAAGFSRMNLTDSKQPLGLPEGSIRAMIALFLIMVFIIFGIYLFRVVGSGFYTPIEKDLPAESLDAKKYQGQSIYIERTPADKYTVYLQTKTSDDGARLAQQLLTTVGTLLVAVSGFYFGSTAVSSAVAAAQGTPTSPNPAISDVKPLEGKKDSEVDFEIVGTDFKSPKAVRLVRGPETMTGTNILSSATKIHCKIKIDKQPDGEWVMVVENEDGKPAQKIKCFKIT